ncbi:2-amino-4-hydroxy-6-hydroxymethyldihydropteridine diphosphokinase [Ruminiclostridium herbifermentans]|uniref:2-amino-4-hydroxy-6-hydroxymethyldihydropteridine diphosphokinase n=1 Tax=Ruminiclostridium herbifermentans TaxID=2488810 RepID=A0A4U7JIU8_9FIRM|nr:2-amino-4-hydroxy-6-hydroxymethyldihydropteridine diphosphokinase [Ruminiclostridium herbifermentans]
MTGKIATAYIALGSNIGNREDNLNKAIEMLKQNDEVEVNKISSYLNTAPVGYTDQPDFLNAVVEVKTTLSPHKLLMVCSDIEKKLKRERIIHWGPRTIDLDILLYEDLVLNHEDLVIPHPRMHEREFVLKPLKEIAPKAFHPVLKKTIEDISL